MTKTFWWNEFSKTGSIDAYMAMKKNERLYNDTGKTSQNESDSNKRC